METILGASDKIKTGEETYSSAIADANNYMSWVISGFRNHLRGKIIEVGIGHGSYCTELSDYGEYLGLDLDEKSVEDAARRFPSSRFAQCDILDISRLESVVGGKADSILSVNVLEHIEDDQRAIANLISVLKPGGHVMLSVPALPFLYNDLDRLAGHVRRYTLQRFRMLLEQQPVEIVRLCYFNPIGGLGWGLNSLKRHSSLNSDAVNGQIRFFDRYVLPVSRVLDPLFRPVFGQSVTCIARRL